MPTFQNTGQSLFNVYSNQTLNVSNPSVNLPFDSRTLNWSTGTSNTITNQTVSSLSKNTLYAPTYQLNITITGLQYFDVGSQPTIKLLFILANGQSQTVNYTAGAGPNGYCTGLTGNCEYNVNNTISLPSFPVFLNASAFNEKNTAAKSWPANNVVLNLTLIMTLNIQCTEATLNQPICAEYCNTGNCTPDFVQYCLTENNIDSSVPCQSYFANTISRKGPSAEIDTAFQTYCKKYTGFEDLFTRGSAIDQELCACNMDHAQYLNLEETMNKLYPGIGAAGVNAYCMLPQCAASRYKSLGSQAVCQVPNCLNIVAFNNDGSFDNSSVTINQTGDCANIHGGGGNTPNTPSNQNLRLRQIILWIVLIVIILILLSLIIWGLFKLKN